MPTTPKTSDLEDPKNSQPQQDSEELEEAQKDAAERREEEGGYQ